MAKAIYFYTALGYVVSIPNTDNSKYDLIIDNGKTSRVQVKTTRFKTPQGIYQVALRTSGGNKSWSGIVGRIDSLSVDLVVIVSEDGLLYEFPAEYLHGRTSVNLGEGAKKYRVELDRW